jgi:citrate lyase beta subunit
VHHGIKGIVFPGPEEPAEVAELGELIAALEKERGVEPGITELVLMLESARGFWNADALAQASPRVTALGVGRIDLTMRLGPVPQGEFRLYRFLMTRALVAARMLDKQPLGAFWRPGSRGGVASKESSVRAATEGRLMGFTGCLCATAEQVVSVNAGFTFA